MKTKVLYILFVLSIFGLQYSSAQNTPVSDNLIINELQVSNVDMYMGPAWNYDPWVEIFNPTSTAKSLSGLYITDDASNLKKYRFTSSHGSVPANGFKVLWFDHYGMFTSLTQINFKPDFEGGDIILSDGSNIISKLTYPECKPRTSYARTTDGGETWKTTGTPTPGTSNVQSAFATNMLPAPVVDTDGKMFTSAFLVNVAIPEGATLRYTTDGTTPTLTNGNTAQTGKFSVSKTTVYRFRLFQDGYLPSPVVSRSYLYRDRNYVFPIISVLTDQKNIYSTEYGVFAQGPNGRPGNGQTSKCNWNMDWDRPVNMEFMLKDGLPTTYTSPAISTYDYATVFNQETSLSMCGGWSRAWTPHSFKLKSEKAYNGENFLPYTFFPNKPYIKNKVLQIRNGGNDNNCRIKDGALQEIVRTSGLYANNQSWQPVHVFINGTYYNVLNMREPNNKHFAYANYGIDTDSVDQFEMSPDSGYVQMEGTDEIFRRWYNLSKYSSQNEYYSQICDIVDIDDYANYMAVQLYLGNTDWPQNNVKGFRDRNNGKFHFVLFDLDHGFGTSSPFETFANKKNYTFDVLHGTGIEGKRNSGEIKFVTIFLNMLNNTTFRRHFIDAFSVVAGSVFEPKRSKEVITQMSSYLSQNSFVNPSSTANTLINNLSSSRVSTLMNSLKSYSPMKITTVRKQLSLTNNCDAAKLYLNDVVIPTGKFTGYVFPPATLKAVTPAGFRFLGWAKRNSSQNTVFAADTNWKYYDRGSLDSQNWKSPSYSDASWSSGKAPLGYAKDGLNTTISYGSNSNNKYPTYYFRKSFSLDAEPSATTEFSLDYTIDDGFVIYVNGIEAGRYNMPSGTISYTTYASTYAQNNPDTGNMTLAASLFHKGDNLIAVEVHNNSATSTDIMWSASLSMSDINTGNMEYVSNDAEYALPASGAADLVAVFQELNSSERAEEKITPVVINEVSAANEVFINDLNKKKDWVELYNTTSQDIDVAGMFLSDNLSKPEKYQIKGGEGISTIIPAHGYLVVWCDKTDGVSQIHSSFKLEDAGGDLILTSADRSWTNKVTYPEHRYDHSWGRYPDGTSTFYTFNRPTIRSANVRNTADVETPTVLLGDANSDGVVDVADITTIASYILSPETTVQNSNFNALNADVNQDGLIDVADITGTASLILAKQIFIK